MKGAKSRDVKGAIDGGGRTKNGWKECGTHQQEAGPRH